MQRQKAFWTTWKKKKVGNFLQDIYINSLFSVDSWRWFYKKIRELFPSSKLLKTDDSLAKRMPNYISFPSSPLPKMKRKNNRNLVRSFDRACLCLYKLWVYIQERKHTLRPPDKYKLKANSSSLRDKYSLKKSVVHSAFAKTGGPEKKQRALLPVNGDKICRINDGRKMRREFIFIFKHG